MEKITANHFITDDKTDKVYMSSLIDKSTGDLDADVRSQLKNCIRHFARKSELLYNTKDVWARDYMPIQLTKDVYLSYTYKPDYLQDIPECITNWQLHKVRTQRQYTNDEHFDFKVVHIPLILDGGNVIKATVNKKPCIIMCDKVLQENNINYEDFQNWWKNWWEENFDGTEMELVLLPWEGSKDNPIGHADGMVRYISDGQILMTNYLDYDEKFKDNHGSRIQLELEKAGFTVNRLHFMDKFEYETDKMFRLLFNKTWCYINFLQIGNSIMKRRISLKRNTPVLFLSNRNNTSNDHLSPNRLMTCLMGQAKYSLRVRSSRLAHLSELNGSRCLECSAFISAITSNLSQKYPKVTRLPNNIR